MNSKSDHHRQSYPLSILFLLIAACAVVLALLTPVVRAVAEEDVGVSESIAASIIGAILTMCVSGAVGLYHYRQLRGLLFGILTGASLGLVLGPLCLAPVKQAAALAIVTVAGAAVLLGIGASFYLAGRQP